MKVLICGLAALIAQWGLIGTASALELPRDGWVRWRVPAVEGAPAWCCIGNWRNPQPGANVCRLDGPESGVGHHSRDATASEIDIYVRQSGGVPSKLRAVAPSCEVLTDTPVKVLTAITPDASAVWLVRLAGEKSTRSHALAALAVQAGPAARSALLDTARSARQIEQRKDAIFWMVQGRSVEGFDLAVPFLYEDADPKLREHAAFALSQSRARDAAPLLIRAAREDNSPKVRGQAWFWLAQMKAPQTETVIFAALKQETDAHVREQAVFALSQLGDERGAKALAALLDNRYLPQDIRKRAVFWLGQSNSDTAIQALDRLLAASPAR